MKKTILMPAIVLMICCLTFKFASAMVVINELLADPAGGLTGDANGDGISSSTQDEFIELLNVGDQSIDLSGWSLSDAQSKRHIFNVGTILLPDQFLVVFGGGAPNLPGIYVQIASTGTLSLNNTGDQVTLLNHLNQIVDQVIYGSNAGNDQSLTRNPDGTGNTFVLHSSLSESQGKLFSPGTTVTGTQYHSATVPEFPGMAYLIMGIGIYLKLSHKRHSRNL